MVVLVVFGVLWKDEGGRRKEGMEQSEQKREMIVHITYIVPTKQNYKKPLGNGKKPACNILAGGGLGLPWGQRLWNARYIHVILDFN
jgi:hypothetical protein